MIRRLPTYFFYPILIAGMLAAFSAGAIQAGVWDCIKNDLATKADISAIIKYARPEDAIRDLSRIDI